MKSALVSMPMIVEGSAEDCREHVTESKCAKDNARDVVEDLNCVTC